MRYRITIDRGNTAVKAALWSDDGTLTDVAKCSGERSVGVIASEMAKRHGCEIGTIVWCTVVASRHDDDAASLAAVCDDVHELRPCEGLGVEIEYRTPSTLGADRLAAVLGALAVAGPDSRILVADIGTAVTYDFIAPGRRYSGGNIAPGIDMRLRSLASYTDALPLVSSEGGEIPLWGTTTAEAMRSGAVRGVAAELAYYHAAAGEGSVTILTGGSAHLIADEKLITFDYILDPCLVHRGLYSIINNEN